MGFAGIVGHEFVGVVEEVNDPDEDDSLVGKRVVGEINLGERSHDFDIMPYRRLFIYARVCIQAGVALHKH